MYIYIYGGCQRYLYTCIILYATYYISYMVYGVYRTFDITVYEYSIYIAYSRSAYGIYIQLYLYGGFRAVMICYFPIS